MAFDKNVTIFADTRESAPVVSELSRLCAVEQRQLFIGDYLCSDRAAIERKTESDFENSVLDGRLFSQLWRMRVFERPILIIERNFSAMPRLSPDAAKNALASVVLGFGVPILFSDSPADTASLIFCIAKREQKHRDAASASAHQNPDFPLLRYQESLVSGLPGVNPVIARRLLEKFRTPFGVFSSSDKELQDVRGVGPEKAKRISEVLHGIYEAACKLEETGTEENAPT